jgi:hypothetical protein
MVRSKTAPVKKPNDLIKKHMKKGKRAESAVDRKKDRKKRRYRPGTRALKEVRKAQKGDNKGRGKLIRAGANENRGANGQGQTRIEGQMGRGKLIRAGANENRGANGQGQKESRGKRAGANGKS